VFIGLLWLLLLFAKTVIFPFAKTARAADGWEEGEFVCGLLWKNDGKVERKVERKSERKGKGSQSRKRQLWGGVGWRL
jgi:hypothetical protein